MTRRNRAAGLSVAAALLAILLLTTRPPAEQEARAGFDTALPGKDVYALALAEGAVWCGGADGLFRVDRDTLAGEAVGAYAYVFALLAAEEGLWVAFDGGLDLLARDGAVTRYTTGDGLPDDRLRALAMDGDGRLWVGGWGGAAVFDGERFAVYTARDGLADDMVNAILQDRDGGMWFGSYVAPRGGVTAENGGVYQTFTVEERLPHANVNAIIQRADGSVVCGGGLFDRGGAAVFTRRDGGWELTDTLTMERDGLAGEKVRSLMEDDAGRLWIGSEYDGLVIRTGEETLKLDTDTGLCHNEVKQIAEDGAYVWIGTHRGLMRIRKGELLP